MKFFEFGLFIWQHPGYIMAITLITSFIIVSTSIPSIVRVAHCKKLYAEPGHRKSHRISIPNLGGIAIFAGIIISTGIFAKVSENMELAQVMAAMVVLFFIGIKDDILVIAPSKKLMGEIFAAFIVVVLANLRFTSMHGFLGIYEIPYLFSVLLTMFVVIVIINAFNLIDGIDGLASAIGIVAATIFGIWFRLVEANNYAILAASIVGSLASFFSFNVYGKSNKIFMGDTGSLVIGLCISVLAIKFNQINLQYTGIYYIPTAPAISFAILIIPLYDTLRVFTIRIYRGKSPFSPDKNHLHHRLLLLGYSHVKSTIVLVCSNLVVFGIALLFRNGSILTLIFIVLGTSLALTFLLEFRIRQHKRRNHVVSMQARNRSYCAINV
jgi:UDP-GlcNAc:undecaprenyl-phosphate/decaprenyl-phosphate GlcNAc-1-phosphate transferase